MSNKEAWVTVVTNDTYGLGALVLGSSLRRVGTTRDMVILVTPGVSDRMREELARIYTSVIPVDVLDSRDSANLALMSRPELGVTFTKLHAWTLVQYSKCVFLDADTLVIQNCDELFEREELSAAPDPGWPDCFNSGVFVLQPSMATYQALLDFAVAHGSFDGGDQGLLNMFFREWATQDIRKHLPFIYNLVASTAYTYLPALKFFGSQVKIVHFLGTGKPWTQQGQASNLPFQRAWWSIFREDIAQRLTSNMILSSPLTGRAGLETDSAPSYSFHDPWLGHKQTHHSELTHKNTPIPTPILDAPSLTESNPLIECCVMSCESLNSNQQHTATHSEESHVRYTSSKQHNHDEYDISTKHDATNFENKLFNGNMAPNNHEHIPSRFSDNESQSCSTVNKQTLTVNHHKECPILPFNDISQNKSDQDQAQERKTNDKLIHLNNYSVNVYTVHSNEENGFQNRNTHLKENKNLEMHKKVEVHSVEQEDKPQLECGQKTQISKCTCPDSSQINNIGSPDSDKTSYLKTNDNTQVFLNPTKPYFLQNGTTSEEGSSGLTGVAGALARGDSEEWRKEAWESGDVDYLGRDSFDNIWRRICETVGLVAQPAAAQASKPVESSTQKEGALAEAQAQPIEEPVQKGAASQPLAAQPSVPVQPVAEAPAQPPSAPAEIVAQPAAPAEEPAQPVAPVEAPAQPAAPAEVPAQPAAPAEAPAQPAASTEAPAQPDAPAEAPAQPGAPADALAQPAPPAETPAQPAAPAEAPTQPAPPAEAPTQPAPPVEGPAQPAALSEAPAQPAAPAEAPAQPAAPAEAPTQPAPPAEAPTQPAPPVAAPAQLAAPAEAPAQPATPAEAPAQPAAPAEAPTQPAAPTETPAQPAAPAEAPAQPAAPAEAPAQPAAPAEAPAQPAAPAEAPTQPAFPAEAPTQLAPPAEAPAQPAPPAEAPAQPAPPAEAPAQPAAPADAPAQPAPTAQAEAPPVPTAEQPAALPSGAPQPAAPVQPAPSSEAPSLPTPPADCGKTPEECCKKPEQCPLKPSAPSEAVSQEEVCSKPSKPEKKPKETPKLGESKQDPGTPTVTPATPASGPGTPLGTEESKLQATPEQPDTPPATSSQSSEPPVPPKRKQGKNGKPAPPKGGKK